MPSSSLWANLVEAEPPIDSAVDFPTRSRLHVALNVVDVEGVLPFYMALFGKAPDLHRDGYAKFESHTPPINISLNRVRHNAKGHGRFGIRMTDRAIADAMYQRLQERGQFDPVSKASSPAEDFVAVDPEQNSWKIVCES